MVQMKDAVNSALSTCKHKQYLATATEKYVQVFNQIFGYVDKIAQARKKWVAKTPRLSHFVSFANVNWS